MFLSFHWVSFTFLVHHLSCTGGSRKGLSGLAIGYIFPIGQNFQLAVVRFRTYEGVERILISTTPVQKEQNKMCVYICIYIRVCVCICTHTHTLAPHTKHEGATHSYILHTEMY